MPRTKKATPTPAAQSVPEIGTVQPVAENQPPLPETAALPIPGKLPRQLSPAQQQCADWFSDLLINGAHRDDAWPMLVALGRFHMRASMERWAWRPESEFAAKLREHAEEQAKWLLAGLTRDWQTQKDSPADEKREPTTVAERVRAAYRNDLRNAFRGFMEEASPEEILWALLVFQHRESTAGYGDYSQEHVQDVPIASAFHYTVESEDLEFIRIPQGTSIQLVNIAVKTALEACPKKK